MSPWPSGIEGTLGLPLWGGWCRIVHQLMQGIYGQTGLVRWSGLPVYAWQLNGLYVSQRFWA